MYNINIGDIIELRFAPTKKLGCLPYGVVTKLNQGIFGCEPVDCRVEIEWIYPPHTAKDKYNLPERPRMMDITRKVPEE